jgi:hypothetical protein
MPCSDHVVLLKATAQHGRRETAVLCRGLEKNGMVGTWHGKCESDTATLYKSNEKETFQTLSGMAWQGNGMLCVNRPLRFHEFLTKIQEKVLQSRDIYVFATRGTDSTYIHYPEILLKQLNKTAVKP